jgi:hypothetical protein
MATEPECDDAAPDGAPASRVYANYLAVGHNMSEVLLDFGQFFGSGAPPSFHTRLITSPLHLRSFHELMGGAIDRYEEEFGVLPGPEAVTRRQ